ncbi:MAG: hypothetical protein ACI9R3_005920 [Verrucomicrobiales bacterium]|jgi:hypothetical protein
MCIRWSAAAEESDVAQRGDLMPGTRWNKNSIAGADLLHLSIDFHGRGAFQNEIDLLAHFVVMPIRLLADGDAGFRQALHRNWSIGAVENTAYGRAVPGSERFLLRELVDSHEWHLLRGLLQWQT